MKWFWTAYDGYMTPENYVAVDAPGSYIGLVDVYRVTYESRAQSIDIEIMMRGLKHATFI